MKLPAIVTLAVASVLLAGCVPVVDETDPTGPPTVAASAMPSPSPSLTPLPATDVLSASLASFDGNETSPSFIFTLSGDAGYSENFEFALPDGQWWLRVACSTDASDTVLVTLDFGNPDTTIRYDAYCGDTPDSGIVSVVTQSEPFAHGGPVVMTISSESRFAAAAGLVPAS